MKKVVILGGGIGGLSAGWMLARTGRFLVTVVEKEPVVGGLCGTFRQGDFYLDYGAHKAYSVIPGILDEFVSLMGQGSIKHKKKNSIYLFGQFLNYPLSMSDLVSKMGYRNLVQCGMSALQSTIEKISKTHPAESYQDFIIGKFGYKLYELVFRSLAEKVWGNPKTLSADIAKTRIPSADIFDVLARVLGLKKENINTDAAFFYYPKGGFGRIPERMAEEISRNGSNVLTNTVPQQFKIKRNRIEKVILNSNGRQLILEADLVISTITLDGLLDLFPADSEIRPDRVFDLVNELEYRCVILVYLFLNKDKVIDDHWIFFPNKDLIFGRIFEQKNMDPDMVPKGKTVICCDFTDFQDGQLCVQNDERLAGRCISDLTKIGLIQAEWVEEAIVRRFSKFYPRYGLNYKSSLKLIYEELRKSDNLLLAGRIGFYNYNNSDHCLDMGRFIADNLSADKSPPQIWTELEERVANYKIID